MERTGLFVRIPSAQARRLDLFSARTQTSKQEVVSALLEQHLSGAPDDRPPGVEDGGVLTLEQAASLLRVDPSSVIKRAEAGELPGRRFEAEWRFSRHALLDWLSGSDGRRQPGFSP